MQVMPSSCYTLALALKVRKIMEYLSHGNQKFLGTVHSVGLATFLWAAFVCMR